MSKTNEPSLTTAEYIDDYSDAGLLPTMVGDPAARDHNVDGYRRTAELDIPVGLTVEERADVGRWLRRLAGRVEDGFGTTAGGATRWVRGERPL